MSTELRGKRVAALVTHGFEQSELVEPRAALERAGARVDVVSPHAGYVRGWKHTEWGDEVQVNRTLDEVKPDVHVNGAEYGLDCIESETVKRGGGRIYIVERVPQLSTSNLVGALRGIAIAAG